MIQSTGSFGIRLLDERLSGPVKSGMQVLVGGEETGKTVAALQFLREGIRQGGRVAMLTQARPESVIGLAHSIGIDLTTHLRSGRWVMIGYRPGIRDRIRRAIEPRGAFEELKGFIGQEGEPDRLAIDTCGPMVEDRGAKPLVGLLSKLRKCATLLTFAEESPGSLDDAFDIISQQSDLILHLTINSSGHRQIVVRKALGAPEPSGPINFDIRDGVGIVPPELAARERTDDDTPKLRRRVLLMDVTGGLPEELRLWFEATYELFYTTDPVDAFPELEQTEFGLVAVHVDRRSADRGLNVMAQLRRAERRPPILIMCPYDLRASDRARALRRGADDFVSGGGLHPGELASRVEALLRRERIVSDVERAFEQPATPIPVGERVLEIVRQRLNGPDTPIFSLLLLRPGNGKGVDELASHVADQMRQGTGDCISVADDRVEVYLEGAMAIHAERFLARVRLDRWKKIAAVIYTAPTDRRELLKIVEQNE